MTDAPATAGTYLLGSYPVHRIGFGAMQLPGPGVFGPPRDRAAGAGRAATGSGAGVNHIDTAQYYGPDVANALIREALPPYPDDLALVSKVGARRDAQGHWPPAQSPAELRAAVEDNLRALGVERLAAVNLRRLDPMRGFEPPPLEDQLAELAALRDEGKIAGIGLSNVTADQVRLAADLAGIVCVQNEYNLLSRSRRSRAGLCSGPKKQSPTCRSSPWDRRFLACRRWWSTLRCGRWPSGWRAPRPRSGSLGSSPGPRTCC